jgi:hypothetical protein
VIATYLANLVSSPVMVELYGQLHRVEPRILSLPDLVEVLHTKVLPVLPCLDSPAQALRELPDRWWLEPYGLVDGRSAEATRTVPGGRSSGANPFARAIQTRTAATTWAFAVFRWAVPSVKCRRDARDGLLRAKAWRFERQTTPLRHREAPPRG